MRKLIARPHFLLSICKHKVREYSKRSLFSQSVSKSACVIIILIISRLFQPNLMFLSFSLSEATDNLGLVL
jgi:hypothetical protein